MSGPEVVRTRGSARTAGRPAMLTATWYPVTPGPAPRQSRRDRWEPSAPVRRYRGYRDLVAAFGVEVPRPYYHAVMLLPMPASWSRPKRARMTAAPHQSKPDKDNLEKALLDAVYRHADDRGVHDGRVTKLWWHLGGMVLADANLTGGHLELLLYHIALLGHAATTAYRTSIPVDLGMHPVADVVWQRLRSIEG